VLRAMLLTDRVVLWSPKGLCQRLIQRMIASLPCMHASSCRRMRGAIRVRRRPGYGLSRRTTSLRSYPRSHR
jgi:hypothetical protein